MHTQKLRLILVALLVTLLMGVQAPAAGQFGDEIVFLPMLRRDIPPANSTDMDTGFRTNCLVTPTGTVKCWGDHFFANETIPGDVLFPEALKPVTIPGLSGVKSLAVGQNFFCALTTAGGVKCWGRGTSGQMGDGVREDSTTPIDVTGLQSGVVSIVAGDFHACALKSSGAMMCWGNDAWGQLGINFNHGLQHPSVPYPVTPTGMGSGVTKIAAGQFHTCAIKGGGLWCWGSNEFGQVGTGTNVGKDYWLPVQVSGLASGVSSVAAGGGTTCAVLTTGALKCWGNNSHGQVGNDTIQNNQPMPQNVYGLTSGVKSASIGMYHTCALLTSGAARCWGKGIDGQLGNGQQDWYFGRPEVVKGISGAAAIYAGDCHSCARLANGTIWCWGSNIWGQLGDGTGEDSLTPVQVIE